MPVRSGGARRSLDRIQRGVGDSGGGYRRLNIALDRRRALTGLRPYLTSAG